MSGVGRFSRRDRVGGLPPSVVNRLFLPRWVFTVPKELAPRAELPHARRMLEKHSVAIRDVRVPLKRQKTLSEDKVLKLAESILADGQTTPIQLRSDGNGYVLIEGLHRLEALRLLGEASVQAYFVRARLH